jgi:hypothetical protein
MKNNKKKLSYLNRKMTSHFTAPNQESHSYMLTDIPDCLKSNSNPQAVKSRNRIFQVSSTSQAQNSGGVILFNIPPANYSISKGTMCLRMRVRATTGAAPTYATSFAAGCLSFQGPGATAVTYAQPPVGGGGSLNASFIPHFGNAYSVIQRLTCYGANSSIIAQHNFLNDEMNAYLQHNSSQSYLSQDASILLGMGQQWYVVGATSSYIDVVLPLPLSIFQSETQNFPCHLLSAPLTIQIDLASLGRAIIAGGTVACSEYTVENTFLLYQAVELPSAMIEAERMAVRSAPYVMTCTNSMNVQVPQNILTSYTLGLNASSIRGVFLLPSSIVSYSVGSQVYYLRATADCEFNVLTSGNGSGVNAQLYFDGNLVNSNIVDNVANTFFMMKQFMHHNIQGSIIQPSHAPPALSATLARSGQGASAYVNQSFCLAFDSTSFDEESTIFGGVPATNVNIQLNGYGVAFTGGATANNLVTISVLYDVLVAFGEDGTISVKR